jgi:hypothetical protein
VSRLLERLQLGVSLALPGDLPLDAGPAGLGSVEVDAAAAAVLAADRSHGGPLLVAGGDTGRSDYPTRSKGQASIPQKSLSILLSCARKLRLQGGVSD